jgi:hypothetical protein
MPLIIAGWFLFYGIVGNLVADHVSGGQPVVLLNDGRPTGNFCRPWKYDKLAWKPWPFRYGRYVPGWEEGSRDWCDGRIFVGGAWVPLSCSDYRYLEDPIGPCFQKFQ